MGANYFPNDLVLNNFYDVIEFDNHSLVQFYHRNLAYLLVIYVLLMSFLSTKKYLYCTNL